MLVGYIFLGRSGKIPRVIILDWVRKMIGLKNQKRMVVLFSFLWVCSSQWRVANTPPLTSLPGPAFPWGRWLVSAPNRRCAQHDACRWSSPDSSAHQSPRSKVVIGSLGYSSSGGWQNIGYCTPRVANNNLRRVWRFVRLERLCYLMSIMVNFYEGSWGCRFVYFMRITNQPRCAFHGILVRIHVHSITDYQIWFNPHVLNK